MMMKPILFPKVNVKTESGTITSWHKKVGEKVVASDLLYEVETDKAIHEVESPYSGVIFEVIADVGDKVVVGDLLAIIEESEE